MNNPGERKNLPNYYLALDIMPGASHNEILHAYNRSKSTYTNGSLASYGLLEENANVSILEEIEQAFMTLGNPARRREYDLKMGYETWTEEDAKNQELAGTSPSVITTLKQSVKNSDAAPAPSTTLSRITGAKNATSAKHNKLAKVANFEPNPEFEKQIEECKQVDGAFLKAVRIYRTMGVDELAHRCKLSASHIESIENENGASLHQPVYLRGHVYLMAQALELPDPSALAISYIERIRALGKLPKTPF